MAGTRSAARLSAFFALALLLIALSPLPLASRIEESVGALAVPAASALRDATRPLADLLLNTGQLSELSAENAELRRHVARLEAEAAAWRESASAQQQVEALTAAAGELATRYLAAAVLLRDPAPALNAIVIDRGSDDGVAVGQPVLGDGATLIGTVMDAGTSRSRVRLLSDAGSAVAAVVQESRVPGAVAGGTDGLRMEFVPGGARVAPGDLIVTSALGGRLPGGLVIGRVSSVSSAEQDLFEAVRIEPLADYARLEHVLILVDFVPGRIPASTLNELDAGPQS